MLAVKGFIKGHFPKFWASVTRIRSASALVPFGLRLLNTIVQRFFRVNGDVPWMVNYTSRVILPKNIQIGKNVWVSFAVSNSCYIQGGNGIKIGDDTIFAPGVKIISANHSPNALDHWMPSGPIEIGQKCWLGANSVILPDVKLGDGCIVGAGAVVTKSFPAGSILIGIPARNIQSEK